MSAGDIAGIVFAVVVLGLLMRAVGGALCSVCRRTCGSPAQTVVSRAVSRSAPSSLTSTATPDPGAVEMQGTVEQPVMPIVMATVVHESVETAAYPVVHATPAMVLPVAGSS